jgi:hypothetical protein
VNDALPNAPVQTLRMNRAPYTFQTERIRWRNPALMPSEHNWYLMGLWKKIDRQLYDGRCWSDAAGPSINPAI